MRSSVAVIVSILALAGLLSPSADASRRRTTNVMIDCLHMRTAPTSILFACADGNYYVDHLTWTRWHNWKASGSGLFTRTTAAELRGGHVPLVLGAHLAEEPLPVRTAPLRLPACSRAVCAQAARGSEGGIRPPRVPVTPGRG